MVDTVVMYSSRHGSTQRYAEWIAQDTGGVALDLMQVRPEDVRDCKNIIYGAPIYGKLLGTRRAVMILSALQRANKVIFTVGMSPADSGSRMKAEGQFPTEIQEEASFFHLPGRLVPQELNLAEKAALKGFQVAKKIPKASDPQDDDSDDTIDLTSHADILPLVESLES